MSVTLLFLWQRQVGRPSMMNQCPIIADLFPNLPTTTNMTSRGNAYEKLCS